MERVEIRWPSGQKTTLTDPALGRSHRVVEPSSTTDADSQTNGSRGSAAMISPDNSSRRRVARRILAVLTCRPAWAAAWDSAAWDYLQSRPSLLDEAIMLAEAEKLDEAEAKVRAYLKKDPDRDAAHLLLSQIILERTVTPSNPTGKRSPEAAQEALDHLSRVRPYNPRMAVAFQLSRGKALDRLLRFDEAEVAWLEALKVDPTAPKAGLDLLNLYYIQVREEEARRLALWLFQVETDPHDRVQLLLKLVELDARPPASGSLVRGFEPVVRQRPGELHCALALGLALTRHRRRREGHRPAPPRDPNPP